MTLVFTLWSLLSVSQTKVDYFKQVIDTTSSLDLKLQSLDSLVFIHKKADQFETSAKYTEQFINLALKNQKYEVATEMLISTFNMLNTVMGQRERALALIEKIEPYVDQMKDSYYKGGLYLKKGGGYFNGKDFQKAIQYYSKAIELYTDPDSIYKADAIYFKGQAHFEMSEFKDAIDNYKLASQYYENLGDKDYTFYTLASAIGIYSVIGFVEKAIEERRKLIQKKVNLKYFNGLTFDYYNQSVSYKKLNHKEKQLEYLFKSLKESKKYEDANGFSSVYSSLSQYYAPTDLKKSKQFLDTAKVYLKNRNNSFSNQQYQMAEAYYLTEAGQEKKAIRIYERTLKDALQSNKSSLILDINKELSKIYQSQGDFDLAFRHYQAYTHLKDSLFDRTKTNALAYYQTLYETEKKESEILQQQSAIEILDAENKNINRLMIFGGIGLGFAFLIILLYRNRMYLQRKHQLKTNYAQNLLRSQDVERQRISKDLHDSLGQSLLLVKHKMSTGDREAKELLNNAIDEMRSISRTLYPLQLKELGITSAIHNLIEQLDENYPDTYIFGDVENIDGILTKESELNLFRIIQECLSNVIKHAKAQSAKLELQKKENKIVITLQDNGIGFDFLSKFKNLKSLGLKTIKERVRYINGILLVESSPGNGAKFNIEIETS
jgi:signal transduction histidine kinase